MDRAISEQAIKLILTEIHLRLGEATRLARAATTCAEAGARAKALNIDGHRATNL